MTAVFLQVRLDSSRLPGKALLMLGAYTIVEHAMRRLRHVDVDQHILVCDVESEEALRPLALRTGFLIFGGPHDDVLGRFVMAADAFSVDTIVRATGDNPLVSAEFASRSVEAHVSAGADYTTYLGLPVGTGVEVVEAHALRIAASQTAEPYDHEHVTPFVYRSGNFRLSRPQAELDPRLGRSRVTVDTVADYQRLLQLVQRAGREDLPDFETLCKWLMEEEMGRTNG